MAGARDVRLRRLARYGWHSLTTVCPNDTEPRNNFTVFFMIRTNIRHTLKPPDWSPRQACKFSSRTFSSEVNVVKASARSRASLPPRISLRTQFSHLQHDKREPWSWFAGNSRRVPDLSLLHILFSSEIDMYEASSN